MTGAAIVPDGGAAGPVAIQRLASATASAPTAGGVGPQPVLPLVPSRAAIAGGDTGVGGGGPARGNSQLPAGRVAAAYPAAPVVQRYPVSTAAMVDSRATAEGGAAAGGQTRAGRQTTIGRQAVATGGKTTSINAAGSADSATAPARSETLIDMIRGLDDKGADTLARAVWPGIKKLVMAARMDIIGDLTRRENDVLAKMLFPAIMRYVNADLLAGRIRSGRVFDGGR